MRHLLGSATLWLALTLSLSAQAPIAFQPAGAAIIPTFEPVRLWAEDLFGSAHEEIVVAGSGGFSIVDHHTGGAPFVRNYFPFDPVTSIAFADFDGNGTRDLVVRRPASPADTIHLILAPASGVATAVSSTTSVGAVHAADLDQDGDQDFLSGAEAWINDGTGQFAAQSLALGAPTDVVDICPGDPDGDGDQDIVLTRGLPNSPLASIDATIFRRNADHSLTPLPTQTLVTGAAPRLTLIADMNNDGRDDLVFAGSDTTNYTGGIVGVALGTAPASFTMTPILGAAFSSAAQNPVIADLDGDGRKDLILAGVTPTLTSDAAIATAYMSTAQGALVHAIGRGCAAFGAHASPDALGIAAVDDDQDGMTDIAVGGANGALSIFRNAPATAALVSPEIAQSLGPDLIVTQPSLERLAIGLTDGPGGPPLYGHSVTLTLTEPGGGLWVRTQAVGENTLFYLPGGISAQPFTAVITTSDGSTHVFTVHPSAAFVNITGGGQSAPMGTPFANPVTATLVDAVTNQPLVGVAVSFIPGFAAAWPNPAVHFTDGAGSVSFNLTAANTAVTSPASFSAADGALFGMVPALTSLGDSVVIDSGLQMTACTGAPVTISGHVFSATGQPRAGVGVALSYPPATATFSSSVTTTAPDGSFAFTGTVTANGVTVCGVTEIGTNIPAQTVQITASGAGISLFGGDAQVTTAGGTFTAPLTVAVIPNCAPPIGTPVTFTTTSTGITLSATTAPIDASGHASITVSTTTAAAGAAVVHAAMGSVGLDFHLFTRQLRRLLLSTQIIFIYQHEHANVPLIFAVDSPATPVLTTPWGAIYTSILAPGPSFGSIDGLGVFGPIAPGMTTNTAGSWSRSFTLPPPLGASFVGQIYGYDLNAAFPYDYIVSNPVTFAF